MAHTNRIADHVIHPSQEEIEAECEMISGQWSPEIKEKRIKNIRFDEASKRAQANLRFLRFLAEFADA